MNDVKYDFRKYLLRKLVLFCSFEYDILRIRYNIAAMVQSKLLIVHLQYVIEIETLKGSLEVVARKTTAELCPFKFRREPLKASPSLMWF
jgi:hypothetical protein